MKNGEVALPRHMHLVHQGHSRSWLQFLRHPLYYEVELVSFVKDKESWDMNIEEKIEAACKKKEVGNALFKAGKYAAKYIEYYTSFCKKEKKQSKTVIIHCNLNNVACKLKLKDYKHAERLCTKVLALENTNVKRLYRSAQAYMDLAVFDIRKAFEIAPDKGK